MIIDDTPVVNNDTITHSGLLSSQSQLSITGGCTPDTVCESNYSWWITDPSGGITEINSSSCTYTYSGPGIYTFVAKLNCNGGEGCISTECKSQFFVERRGRGDLNNDGNIIPGDALIAFKCYLGTGKCPEFSDVNRDGSVTPADALCIFEKAMGKPSCLDIPN